MNQSACHSYNVIDVGSYKMRVATLDTMLSFYLAFFMSIDHIMTLIVYYA